MNPLNALGSNVGPVLSKPGKTASQHDGTVGWTGAGPSFAALFSGAAIQSSGKAAASGPAALSGSSDPLAQLTALVQRGTPLSTIVARLSQQLASAVTQKLPAQTGARLGSALAKSIANALSPPGNAPPGTAAEQVAALAARLQRWIATLARETAGNTGQQNDIAGNILDAKSAKDIPAQRKPATTASNDIDPAALARALLGSVASDLSPAPVSAAPVSSDSPKPPVPVSAPATQPQTPAPSLSAPASSITMANAPDLLARMLVRAAGVDARVNGNAMQNPTITSNADATPADLVARFSRALETEGASLGGDSQPHSDGKAPSQDQSFAAAAAANAQPTAASAAPPQTAAPASLVNANDVVEQVVKSMMMRTTQTGSSEIHLHLSPEHLGEVMMKITVTGSTISANVVAQNGEVRNALLANQQQLVRSLSDAGMTLSGFSVDVSGGDAGRDSNKDRTAGFGRRYVVHELGAANEGEPAQPSSLGPPLLPKSSLDLLNYLA